jgi:hypothetical protein
MIGKNFIRKMLYGPQMKIIIISNKKLKRNYFQQQQAQTLVHLNYQKFYLNKSLIIVDKLVGLYSIKLWLIVAWARFLGQNNN